MPQRPPTIRAWLEPGEDAVDLFAGGGGASAGVEAALGRHVDIAINHDPVAIAVHKANHPHTKHYLTDVWEVKPRKAVGKRRVGLLWASPDCRHFSNAKGDVPRNKKVRALAWVVCRWAEEVRPRVIFLENVREFLTWGPLGPDGRPDKARAGETFARWKKRLERAGYVIDYRLLDASEYGAPTRRKRLFVVARSDGQPIVWPETTHGTGKAALHTAAECIDWSLECPSIFDRKKPLVEKTLWRVAQGIRRFVLENPRPFIIKVNHGKREFRGQSLDAPLSTVTATERGHAVVSPTLVQTGYGERPGQRPRFLDLHTPLGTIVGCGQKHALVAAFLAKHFGDPNRKDGGGGIVLGAQLGLPMPTVTTRDHHSLVSAVLVEPGQRHGRRQQPADAPLSTVMGEDRRALAAVTLATFRGTSASHPGCAAIDQPLPTISAGGEKGGIHVAEVRAFLTTYYGSDGTGGQEIDAPMRTVRTKDCLGLVTVEGVDYEIADIGFRMLEPHELLRAQFGRHASGYDLSPAKTKKDQVRLIGNSVCPEVAEQIVLANMTCGQRQAA